MSPVFAPYHHNSPHPTHIPADLSEVKLAAREIADTLPRNRFSPAMHDVIISGKPTSGEGCMAKQLRSAIEDTLPDLGTRFGIRLRVIANERKARAERVAMTGTPLNNFHTDFQTVETAEGIKLMKKKKGRITATFDGAGTLVASGTMRAHSSQLFVPRVSKRNHESIEKQMAPISPLVIGDEGQFLRGPKDNAGLFKVEGDFSIVSLLPDRWYELDPDTVHATPENLTEGRIVVNVDRI